MCEGKYNTCDKNLSAVLASSLLQVRMFKVVGSLQSKQNAGLTEFPNWNSQTRQIPSLVLHQRSQRRDNNNDAGTPRLVTNDVRDNRKALKYQ